MRWKRIYIAGVGALILLVFSAAPRLLSWDQLRLELQAQIAALVQEPVEIRRMHISLFPLPRMVLSGVRMGDPDQPKLEAELAVARLKFSELLQGRVHILEAQADQIHADVDFLRALAAQISATEPSGETGFDVQVKRLVFTGVHLRTAAKRLLGPYQLVIPLNAKGHPEVVQIARSDLAMQAELQPRHQHWSIELRAQAWQPPWQGFPKFQQLHATGQWDGQQLQFADLDAEVFGGRLSASGRVDWQQRLELHLTLTGKDLNLVQLKEVTTMPRLAGRLDGNCELTISAGAAFSLEKHLNGHCRLQAKRFRLKEYGPMRADFRAATITTGASIDKGVLNLDDIKIQAYDGLAQGTASIGLDHNLHSRFAFSTRDVNIEPFTAVFIPPGLAGRLTGDCDLKLPLLARPLTHSTAGECRLEVRDGALLNTDLAQAANVLSKQSSARGQTPFDRLSSTVALRKGDWLFEDILIQSRVLEASGRLRIDVKERLDGDLEVGLKQTGGIVGVPVIIAGELGDPHVYPAKSAVVGGAAGTVLLGPGIGTALGIKAGQAVKWLGGIFARPATAGEPEIIDRHGNAP